MRFFAVVTGFVTEFPRGPTHTDAHAAQRLLPRRACLGRHHPQHPKYGPNGSDLHWGCNLIGSIKHGLLTSVLIIRISATFSTEDFFCRPSWVKNSSRTFFFFSRRLCLWRVNGASLVTGLFLRFPCKRTVWNATFTTDLLFYGRFNSCFLGPI